MTHPQATRFLAKHMLSASKAGADLDWASLRKQAADEGLKLSDEDLNGAAATILSELSKAGQLSDDELDMVAGGTRQVVSTAFQNFDQKANQTYNILSSVMKSMNEMRMGTIRNMLWSNGKKRDGKRALVLRDAQHEYVFVEGPGPGKLPGGTAKPQPPGS